MTLPTVHEVMTLRLADAPAAVEEAGLRMMVMKLGDMCPAVAGLRVIPRLRATAGVDPCYADPDGDGMVRAWVMGARCTECTPAAPAVME